MKCLKWQKSYLTTYMNVAKFVLTKPSSMPTWWVEIISENSLTVFNLFSSFLKAFEHQWIRRKPWNNQVFPKYIIFLKLLYAAAIILHKYGYRYLLCKIVLLEFFLSSVWTVQTFCSLPLFLQKMLFKSWEYWDCQFCLCEYVTSLDGLPYYQM